MGFLDGFVERWCIECSLLDGLGVMGGFVKDSVSAVALRTIDCNVRDESLEIDIKVRCSNFGQHRHGGFPFKKRIAAQFGAGWRRDSTMATERCRRAL